MIYNVNFDEECSISLITYWAWNNNFFVHYDSHCARVRELENRVNIEQARESDNKIFHSRTQLTKMPRKYV
jgi:hypothetical protein